MNAFANPVKSFSVDGFTVNCEAIDKPGEEALFVVVLSIDVDGTTFSLEPSYYEAEGRNHFFSNFEQTNAQKFKDMALEAISNPESLAPFLQF